MNNLNLVRGAFLIAIALTFGMVALTYSVGDFSHPGPGLFPLVVSVLLLVIGIATVVRSRYVVRIQLDYSVKNIALVIASLSGFVLISQFINMILGIAFLVFCSSYCGKSPSWQRSLKITACLIVAAFMFQRLLGLNLPLY